MIAIILKAAASMDGSRARTGSDFREQYLHPLWLTIRDLCPEEYTYMSMYDDMMSVGMIKETYEAYVMDVSGARMRFSGLEDYDPRL